MARAQTLFKRARGRGEVDPVVNKLIRRESGEDTGNKKYPRPKAENRQCCCYQDGGRDVGVHSEDGARIAMMNVMQRRHERAMRMTEHAVNDVFDQRPCEKSGGE